MSTDIRNNYIGPCSLTLNDTSEHGFDITMFVIRLLLFDKFIVQSNRLEEIKSLLDLFGYGGVKEILASGAIQIHDQAHGVAQTGQTGLGFRGKKKDGAQKNLLPLNSFSFDIIKHANEKEIMHNNMQKLHSVSGLKRKEVINLKNQIANNLVKFPNESTKNILGQTLNDFRNNTPNLRKAIELSAKKHFKIKSFPLAELKYSIDVDDENDVHFISNLKDIVNLNERQQHDLIQKSLLAIGGLNKRIETMRAFSAVTGFQEGELPIFEEKLDFIRDSIAPEPTEKYLKEILSCPAFPNIDEAVARGKLNVKKLLSVRNSEECKEFRAWLWNCEANDINELKERISSLSSKLSLKVSSKPGRLIRWLVTSAVGLSPDFGFIAGQILGLLDLFLVEKIFKSSGNSAFLDKQYPTIFKGT